MSRGPLRRIGVFVSSHGFGHASRTCAVLERLIEQQPDIEVELYTSTPEWFFEQSLAGAMRRVSYRHTITDVGLVQSTALREDLEATASRLDAFLPFADATVERLAEDLQRRRCQLVVADISPLGLAAAARAGLPSILLENFTWDWIYRHYGEDMLVRHADYLEPIFASADLRIQAEPWCYQVEDADHVGPISRRPRHDRETIRQQLGVKSDRPLIMVTMGGVEWRFEDLERRLAGLAEDFTLLVAGGGPEPCRLPHAIILPHKTDFYHPDLIAASDAVVGKLGYSTIAEIAAAGTRYGYIPRPNFPESPPLERWVDTHLASHRIPPEDMESGDWVEHLNELMALQPRPALANGADAVSEAVVDQILRLGERASGPLAPSCSVPVS